METQSLLLILPDAQLKVVQKALLDTFGHVNLTDIVSVSGGLSGALVYKIEIDDQFYILKLDGKGKFVSDDRSFLSLELASKAGISPKVYYLNISEGISITAFINHVPLRAVFNSPDLLLTKLAKTIRSIHQIPLFEKEKNLFVTIDSLVTDFKKSGMLASPSISECLDYFEVIRKHYPWHEVDNVSSHNDLNPSNITCDGEKIWIIDWDMASQNDRYVDLATTANFFVQNDEQEKYFLTEYFECTPDAYQSARFFLMRQTCRLVYAILMFKLADKLKPLGTTHDDNMQTPDLKEIGEKMRTGIIQISSYKGQLLFGKALINEALKNMRSARFNLSVKVLDLADSFLG